MSDEDVHAEKIAAQFHATYEALAPAYGYQTRPVSAVPWRQVPINNRQLMVGVMADEFLRGEVAGFVWAVVLVLSLVFAACVLLLFWDYRDRGDWWPWRGRTPKMPDPPVDRWARDMERTRRTVERTYPGTMPKGHG